MNRSDKSYGAAVSLCAVFGVLGIHHFYLGCWIHGLFDLFLTILGFALLLSGYPLSGIIVLLIDGLHTLAITILLLIGSYNDGKGNRICYPGQTFSEQQ